MGNYVILFIALLPIVIFVFYICYKDKKSPEPIKQLVKAFFWGALSAILSLCISIPLSGMGASLIDQTSVQGSISSAFLDAAIPEETTKLFVLWLLLRKNRYFDERMDGIVYAVCVSLGFAALENVLYLFANVDSYLSVGLGRAIFSIPGHFCFGVLMGYYYSLAKFYSMNRKKNKVLTFIIPIIAHGLYDSILFVMNVIPTVSGILSILFLIFCFKMWKYGSKSIKKHLERDRFNEAFETFNEKLFSH